MHSVRKPWWQQATALVTVSTGGVITGFNFVPGAAATMTSPSQRAAAPARAGAGGQARPGGTGDAQAPAGDRQRGRLLPSARANQDPGPDGGADLGQGQRGWRRPRPVVRRVRQPDPRTGRPGGRAAKLGQRRRRRTRGRCTSGPTSGSTPTRTRWASRRWWPDAQAHGRWHPLGDGYQPQPGDWVVFDGHVEVVTSYADGVLDTIGADSLPNLTVNAHSFRRPARAAGRRGVRRQRQPSARRRHAGRRQRRRRRRQHGAGNAEAAPAQATRSSRPAAAGRDPRRRARRPRSARDGGQFHGGRGRAGRRRQRGLPRPARRARSPRHRSAASARPPRAPPAAASRRRPLGGRRAASVQAIPDRDARDPQPDVRRRTGSTPRPPYATPGTRNQQAFISLVAPGALAAQQRYGVPASVTIAQAIDESAWGTSQPRGHVPQPVRHQGQPGRRAASPCRLRSTRTASGSRSTPSSASTTTTPSPSPTTRSSSPPAATTPARWRTARSPTPSRTT